LAIGRQALLKDQPEYRPRVDHLRLYAHYLYLRTRVEAVAAAKDKAKVRQAIAGETVFGPRLMNTSMIHSRPLMPGWWASGWWLRREFVEGPVARPRGAQTQVGVIRQVGSALTGTLGRVAFGESLQTPGDPAKQKLAIIGSRFLTEDFLVAVPQLAHFNVP